MSSYGQITKEHNTRPNQIASISASIQRLLSKLRKNRAQALGLHLKRLVELLFTDIGHDSLAIVVLVHPSGVCQRSHHHARKLIHTVHLYRSVEIFSCDADAFHLTTFDLTGALIAPHSIYDRGQHLLRELDLGIRHWSKRSVVQHAVVWDRGLRQLALFDSRNDISLHSPSPTALPSPTFPRKFADVDRYSRKINPEKICAECWPGAAFGPYWLLTERLRYETTPLQPALRDRVRVHGQLDDAHGSHRGSHTASTNSRAAGASRRHEQRRRQGRRRHRRKCGSRYRRGQRRNIHRHQRSQHGKRRRHQCRHHRRNHHPHPIPARPNQPHTRGHLHHVTNRLRPLRHRKPKRRHLHRLVERRPRGHRDDLPRNPGQRLVPGQGAHGRAHLLGRRQP